jgi:hypothetical protein
MTLQYDDPEDNNLNNHWSEDLRTKNLFFGNNIKG